MFEYMWILYNVKGDMKLTVILLQEIRQILSFYQFEDTRHYPERLGY